MIRGEKAAEKEKPNALDLASLHSAYAGGLQAFLASRSGDPHLAEDLVQEVFIRLQKNQHKLRKTDSVKAWLYTTARRLAADHFRRQKPVPEEEDIPEEPFRTEELSACVPHFIMELPEPYRTALKQVEIEGLSQREYAEQIGISYSGAKSRIQRGRQMLKSKLEECCSIQTDRYGNVIDYAPRSGNRG